jgi:hypothetical protein
LTYMRYPATPTLSVEGFHAILMEFVEAPVATSPDGTDGGAVSGDGAVVVAAVVVGVLAVVAGGGALVVVGAGAGALVVVGGGAGALVVVGAGAGGAGVVVARAELVVLSGDAVTAGQGHATDLPASVMQCVVCGRSLGDEELWMIEIWYPSHANSPVGFRVTETVIVLSCQGGLNTILPVVFELRWNRQ